MMTGRVLRRGWRHLIVLAALLAFAATIARNLVYWQVIDHGPLSEAASRLYESEVVIPARRGRIVDATGLPLATSVLTYDVAADPSYTAHPRAAAIDLAHALHRAPGPLRALLAQRQVHYVLIQRQVDAATAATIRAQQLQGVILTPSWRTVFPQGTLAAAVLGFVNADGVGQYGLEQSYDRLLRGRDGTQFATDAADARLSPAGAPRPAVDGATLVLTIDGRLQSAVEQRLAEAVRRYGAESGSAIVMDPHTGAILAMASLPTFDPNAYGQVTDLRAFDNLALQSYQPGSTFKIVSVAAGLDSHAFTPRTVVYDPGYYSNYGITVHNWQAGVGWGAETPEKMLRYSANVGMAQFANLMGPLTFYRYVTGRFGFGRPTGIDLPDESAGLVRTPGNAAGLTWQMEDLLTNSYGQGIDVTPLQMLTAAGALANHGWRMRPYLVQRILAPGTARPLLAVTPQRLGQAVGAQTAATMTRLLQASAVDGEATCALTAGYAVAAKTGTATIEGPSAYGMNFAGGTVASLIGYGPLPNPRFVMLVTIRRPQPGPLGNDIWGSVVAAPAWHDIAEDLYRLLGLTPQPGSTPADLAALQGSGPRGWDCAFQPGR